MTDSTDPVSEGLLTTKGVTSTVYSYDAAGKPAGRHGRYGAGHVALFDHDTHATPAETVELFDREGIEGPTIILESSPSSYHAVNLAVRKHPETVDLLAAGEDDTKHRDIGERRGFWRLRAGPKLHRNRDEYKPAPTVVDGFCVVTPGPSPPVSEPHAMIYRALARADGLAAETMAVILDYLDAAELPRGEYVGDTTELVTYATMTDREKDIQALAVNR